MEGTPTGTPEDGTPTDGTPTESELAFQDETTTEGETETTPGGETATPTTDGTATPTPDGETAEVPREDLWEMEELVVAGGEFDYFVRQFGQDNAGEIYVLANREGVPEGNTGVVMRIVPPEEGETITPGGTATTQETETEGTPTEETETEGTPAGTPEGETPETETT